MELQKLFVSLALKADEFKKGLQDAGGQAEGFRARAGGMLDKVGSIGRTAFRGVGVAAVAGFKLAMSSAINMNASLEQSTMMFTTLMGDADLAKEHVAGLFDFAASTPFETGPVIEASKHLQIFGGAALNTEENLTLVGDAAAAVGAPIDEVGFWVGRLYSNLQAGQPFGEAAARLQELGIMAPETRTKLEEMQKTGEDGAVVWGEFQNSLGSFTGAMELQSQSWTGLTSTIKDQLGLLTAEALQPFFEVMKTGLGELATRLSSPEVKEGIANLAAKLGEFAVKFTAFLTDSLIPFLAEHGPTLVKILAAVALGFGALTIVATVAGWISAIASAVTVVMPILTAIAGVLSGPVLLAIGAVIAIVALLTAAWKNNWGDIQGKVAAVWAFLKPIFEAIVEWIGEKIKRDIELLKQVWADVVWPAIQRAIDIVWPVIEKIFKAIATFITDTLIPTIQKLWQKWSEEIWPDIQTVLENVWTIIEEVFTEIGRWINDNIVPWIEFLKKVWVEQVWPAIQTKIEEAWAIIEPIWEAIRKWAAETIPPILETLKGVFETVMGGISAAIQPVKDLWDRFVDAVSGFWDWISNKVFNFNISIPDLPSWAVPGSPLPIHTAWQDFADDMDSIGLDIANGFELAFGGMFDLSDKWGGVSGGIAGHFERLVIKPLKDGIDSATGVLERTMPGIAATWKHLPGFQQLDWKDASQMEAVLTQLYRQLRVGTPNSQMSQDIMDSIAALNKRNQLEEEYIRQQEKLLALEKARADMDFLKQQMDLLKLVGENAANLPPELLKGVTMGLTADPGQLMGIMVDVMERLVRNAQYELNKFNQSPAVTGTTPGTDRGTTMNIQTQNINGGQHINVYGTEESELERLMVLLR